MKKFGLLLGLAAVVMFAIIAVAISGCAKKATAPENQSSVSKMSLVQGNLVGQAGVSRQILFNLASADFTDLKGEIVTAEVLADWIISDSLNAEEFKQLLSLPAERQLCIIQAGALQLGVPKDKIDMAITELRKNMAEESGNDDQVIAGSCGQGVEYSSCSGLSGCWNEWFDAYCDGDPGDGEYVFAAYPSWRDDADHVRWYTYNPWLRFIFSLRYHSTLLGVDACAPEIRLCIGDTGVWAAGGPVFVSLYLFVGHV